MMSTLGPMWRVCTGFRNGDTYTERPKGLLPMALQMLGWVRHIWPQARSLVLCHPLLSLPC